jgi:membrane protease YdiL (CAAX protease family)
MARFKAFIHFPLVRVFIAGLAVVLAFVAAQKTLDFLPLDCMGRGIVGALLCIAATFGAYFAYVRFIERRPFFEFSRRDALKELGLGALIGMLLFTSTIGVLAALGVYQFTAVGSPANLILPFTSAITAAVFEEVLFRGVLFRIIEQWVGTWLSMVVSAILFGLIHLVNPHATLIGAIAIIFEAGILLAAAYLMTRRLWFPIGLHAAWNFTQGGIFGIAVSGVPGKGFLLGSLNGPEWLSGGEFGAEASVVAIVLCLAVALGFISWARRANRIQYPWRGPASRAVS